MQLYRHLTANHVTLKEMSFMREIAMEAYLIDNPDLLALDEDDLSTVEIVEAEVPMPRGRRSKQGDGRIDLLAIYGDSTVGVVELKHGELNEGHLQQLDDYLANMDQIKNKLQKRVETEAPKFLGVLVGTSITSSLKAKMEKGLVVQDSIPIAALTLARYAGNDNNVYVVTDTFFRNVSHRFDMTKYEFNGRVYGKNRLVLACIKKYVEDHPALTFSALEKAFPRKLQGSRGCFDTVDTAQGILARSGHRRHFLRPEELVELGDAKIAVCDQWGIGNISRFLEAAQNLGFKIKKATV